MRKLINAAGAIFSLIQGRLSLARTFCPPVAIRDSVSCDLDASVKQSRGP
jgi:hypothetical protein